LVIIEDSRQQIGKHAEKLKFFQSLGIKVVRSKLYVGDFSRLNNQNICIDTKKDIIEIAGNICGEQHTRFRNECIRAKECGIKLIILIEEPYTLETLKYWKSPIRKYGRFKGKPLSQVNGETLAKAMITMQDKYGVIFAFTDKKDCGRKIVEILTGA
jgi:ribosome-associated protein